MPLFRIDTSGSNKSTSGSSEAAQNSGRIFPSFHGTWTIEDSQESMQFQKLQIHSTGQVTAQGGDANGMFIVRGDVKPDLTFSAMKMYPDHAVFLWGQAGISAENAGAAASATPPLEQIDSFQGEWGFEENESMGTFQIWLD